jgi:hypothetical protein
LFRSSRVLPSWAAKWRSVNRYTQTKHIHCTCNRVGYVSNLPLKKGTFNVQAFLLVGSISVTIRRVIGPAFRKGEFGWDPQYENVTQGVGHVLNTVFYILQCVADLYMCGYMVPVRDWVAFWDVLWYMIAVYK